MAQRIYSLPTDVHYWYRNSYGYYIYKGKTKIYEVRILHKNGKRQQLIFSYSKEEWEREHE